jgi:uncharacterized membrane protein
MTHEIIAAQHFEGELYIKASDHHRIVRAKVSAEREECAKVADLVAREIDDTNGTATYIAAAIRARGQE